MRLAVNAVIVLSTLGTLSCKDSSGPAEELYEPDVRWSEISTGGGDFIGHTCGRTDAGKVYCWGGYLSAAVAAGPGGETRAPSRLNGGMLFRAIDVGYRHACGITTDGAQYCWGDWNWDSSLQEAPSAQRIGSANNYVAIEGRSWSACALTTEAEAMCWSTHLTHAAYGLTSTPTRAGGALRFKAVTAGNHFGESYWCGLTPDGAAHCWGGNTFGTLGDSGRAPRATATQPVAVTGGHVFKTVSAGYIACGLTEPGDVYCWGPEVNYPPFTNNSAGGLVPTKLLGAPALDTISVGEDHACGLTSDGSAWCWGRNDRGQLGITAAISGSNTPHAVSGGLKFQSISVGNDHTCGVTADGAGYCWGRNESGQLGDASVNQHSGFEQFSRTPVRVHPPSL
jgi:alpha-tubulin suppressor-like RCC1 family protein